MTTSKLFAALAAAIIAAPASADILDNVWLTTGFKSHHLSNNDQAAEMHGEEYNEANKGVGLEYKLDRGDAISVGLYDNSINRTTHYALYVWRPLHLGDHISAGVAAGLINGYDHYHNGGYGPALVPCASIEFAHVGANIVYVPPIQGVDSVIALQLKFHF